MAELAKADLPGAHRAVANQVAIELVAQAAAVLERHGVMTRPARAALREAWRTCRSPRWDGKLPAALVEEDSAPS